MVEYTRGVGFAAAFCRAACAAGAVMALALASPASHAQNTGQNSAQNGTKNGAQKFDSKGHPKSEGIALTVTYPSGWKANEGVTTDSIQRFSGEYRDFYGVLLISLRTFGRPVEDDCRGMSLQDAGTAFASPETQLSVRQISKITHEAQPGFLLDLLQRSNSQGTDIYLQGMAVCRGQQIVMLMCSPVKLDTAQRRVRSSAAILQEAQPLCTDFFSSLKLNGP